MLHSVSGEGHVIHLALRLKMTQRCQRSVHAENCREVPRFPRFPGFEKSKSENVWFSWVAQVAEVLLNLDQDGWIKYQKWIMNFLVHFLWFSSLNHFWWHWPMLLWFTQWNVVAVVERPKIWHVHCHNFSHPQLWKRGQPLIPLYMHNLEMI